MSGNDDRGARPIIPEFLESQDLIDPSPVFTKKRKVPIKSEYPGNKSVTTESGESTNNKVTIKSEKSRNNSVPTCTKSTDSRKKRLFRKSPGSSQRRIDVMWGYNINDDSGLQADMSPSEDTSSPVLNRKKQPQSNQTSSASLVNEENQDKLPDPSTDDEVFTPTHPEDQLNDEGILNTQESLFDGDYWVATKYAGNTPYSFTPLDSSSDTSDDDVYTHDDDVSTHTHTETRGDQLNEEGFINTQESLFDSPFAGNIPYPVDISTPYRGDTPHLGEIRYRTDTSYSRQSWHVSPQSSPSTSNPPLRFDFSDDSCASESFQRMLKETFKNVVIPETPLSNPDNNGTETVTWGTQAFTPNVYIDLLCNTKTSQTDISGLTGQNHKLFNRQLGRDVDLSAWTAGYHDDGLPDRSEHFTQTSETGGYLVDKSVQTGMDVHFTGRICTETYLCEWYSKSKCEYKFCDRATQTILL